MAEERTGEAAVSVSIKWRRVAWASKPLVGTSDKLAKLCTICGGEAMRATVTSDHVAALRAAAIASGECFYGEVADLVEAGGDIEVWGEW